MGHIPWVLQLFAIPPAWPCTFSYLKCQFLIRQLGEVPWETVYFNFNYGESIYSIALISKYRSVRTVMFVNSARCSNINPTRKKRKRCQDSICLGRAYGIIAPHAGPAIPLPHTHTNNLVSKSRSHGAGLESNPLPISLPKFISRC